MKNSDMARRVSFSITGLRTVFWRERSFRTHVLLSALLIGLASLIQPPPLWWAVLLLAVAAGLAMEAINGAVEALADLVEPDRHPVIGAVKDMASAAAFIVNMSLIAVSALMVSTWA